MAGERRRYIAYLLRLWRVNGAESAHWRASLEDPHTGERKGFSSLDNLVAYLYEQIGRGTAPADDSRPIDA